MVQAHTPMSPPPSPSHISLTQNSCRQPSTHPPYSKTALAWSGCYCVQNKALGVLWYKIGEQVECFVRGEVGVSLIAANERLIVSNSSGVWISRENRFKRNADYRELWPCRTIECDIMICPPYQRHYFRNSFRGSCLVYKIRERGEWLQFIFVRVESQLCSVTVIKSILKKKYFLVSSFWELIVFGIK